MKGLLFAIVFAVTLLCVSCGVSGTPSYQKGVPDTVIMEGHDYFKNVTYGLTTYVYTHKGNCMACEERWKKLDLLLSR